MAEIFVLLLGDIDLAAGYTAACGAVIACGCWRSATLAVVAAVLVGLASPGRLRRAAGEITARLGLPSFVVTLAGQLGLSGLLLYMMRPGRSLGTAASSPAQQHGDQRHRERPAMSPLAGWIVMIVIAWRWRG